MNMYGEADDHHKKPPRNLQAELRHRQLYDQGIPSANAQASGAMCQLKMQLNCCQGRGFTITTTGALTRAQVCSCVTSCQVCLGQARFLQDNKAVPCHKPHPRVVANLLNGIGLPSRYGLASLSQFNNFTGNGQETLKAIKSWAHGYEKSQRGLLLEGPVGVGKTYILAALAKGLAARGFSVKFVDFFQLLSQLKANYSANRADDATLKPLIDVDILIIDELGKGRNSDWELSILDQLVMGRYNQNKTILASTNYTTTTRKAAPLYPQHLDSGETFNKGFRENQFDQTLEERVGSRIYSRLLETCLFLKLSGDDFRRRFAQTAGGATAFNETPQP